MLIRLKNTTIVMVALGLCLWALACFLPSKAWAQTQNQGQNGERYCIWLFWTKEPALIKQALERLAQGDPFMVVARDTARQHPKTSQANADCMLASGMDPAVLAAARNLRIGELSRPFDLGGGTAMVMRTTDAHRREAQKLYAEGRYAQAERELLRDLKLHPASASAWHMLSLTRTAQGNYKQALNALDKALSLNPNNPAMLNDKASALANLGRAQEAVPVFEKARQRDPENPTIMSNLAWALTLAKKDPKRALALAKEACQAAPKEARTWHTLAKVQAAQGRHSEAVVNLRQTLILAPKHTTASQDLADSIKALNPKILARLNQDCAPGQAVSPAKPKPKAEVATDLPKGLKRAPDLAGPAIRLPSQWPALSAAKATEKPKEEPALKNEPKPVVKAAAKDESKPLAKAEEKPPAPSTPAARAGKRIVSLPMPKFPEQTQQQPKKDRTETEAKDEKPQTEADKPAKEPKPEGDQPKAESGKTEPKEDQAGSESAGPEAHSEPGKHQSKAEAEIGPKPEPAKPEAESEQEPIQTASTDAAGEAQTQRSSAEPVPPSAAAGPDKLLYLIQVASYRPESLAQKELNSWKRRQIAGHIETWQDRRGRTWHRVLLGPFATLDAAEIMASELKAKRLVRDYYVVKRPTD